MAEFQSEFPHNTEPLRKPLYLYNAPFDDVSIRKYNLRPYFLISDSITQQLVDNSIIAEQDIFLRTGRTVNFS